MTLTGTRPERSVQFHAPEVPAMAVARPSVLARLLVALEKRLTVVVAPPGYGKTVLLMQAARSLHQKRVRWISLEPRHDDVAQLCVELVAALGSEYESVTPGASIPGPPRTTVQQFDAFLNGLGAVAPTVLVLDDLDRLTSGASFEVLALLADHAPHTVHIVVATRFDPPLPLYRMHVSDTLAELRQRDMAFSVADAAKLLRGVSGHELTAAQVRRLVERTEGWAAGLHLAAMSLRECDDIDSFIDEFTGDDRQVAEYLTDAVLERIPDDEREFLLSTCLLDPLTPGLCDAVRHENDGHRMLEHLVRRSMFITQVPNGDAYRYHGLFRAYLRQRLHDDRPERERVALRAAAEWQLGQNELGSAVGYFAAAANWDGVVEIATSVGRTMLSSGRAREVSEWLALVPDAEGGRDEGVALLRAVAAVAAGGRHGFTDAIESFEELGGSPAVACVVRALHALATDDASTAATLCEAVAATSSTLDTSSVFAIDGITGSSDDLASAIRLIRGVALTYLGDLSSARPLLEAGLEASYPFWRLEANASLALVELWSGRLSAAERHARRALALGRELPHGSAAGIATATVALAGVLRQRDDLPRAGLLLDDARTHAGTQRVRLLGCLLAVEQGRITLTSGHLTGARSLAGRYRPPDETTFPEYLRSQWHATEAQLLLASGDVHGAAAVLDVASVDGLDVTNARVELAVARGDVPGARRLLADWPEGPQPIASLERRLWEAVLEHFEGRGGHALEILSAVASEAERDGNVGLFRGQPQIGLVRALYRAQPRPFLRNLIERTAPRVSRRSARELAEQLTERECSVLALLPTRLTNIEIADRLGVSVNTVKTHLRHVYQKLQVENRNDAITVAERLHLL